MSYRVYNRKSAGFVPYLKHVKMNFKMLWAAGEPYRIRNQEVEIL